MTAQLAMGEGQVPLRGRIRLPKQVPPFNTLAHRIFTVIWVLALLLALVGPVMALYDRYTSPGDNSQLVTGSRGGFAVSLQDATRIRFIIGPEARAAGLQKGDHIIAVYGLPMPDKMPVTERALAAHGEDPAYVAMGNLLFGTESLPFPLTVRSLDGKVHEVTVTTSEDHIRRASAEDGVPPVLLSFIDVVHVIFYPFLIWAAWLLHRRNARDAVSSVLSLAILLMIAAELPSSNFLASIGVPRPIHVAMYDLGNVFLITGILLFPHGNLTPKTAALIAASPLLLFLSGQLYESYFLMLLIVGVLFQIRSLRVAEAADLKQQIRWALFGFTGYAVFKAISYIADLTKYTSGSFAGQLGLELTAGLTFGLSMLVLQLGLLVALIRYRLYDAEFVISRSANFALITLAVTAVFAGVADALKQIVYNYYGNSSSEGPIIMAAALATVLINPIQDRIQAWSENRFQKNLVLLRDDLPDSVRDLRETASLGEMSDQILQQVDRGVRAVRSAIIVDGEVFRSRDISIDDVEIWRHSKFAADYTSDICEATDKTFPIRVPLVPSSDKEEPIGFLLVGPRPDGSIPSRDEQKALKGVSEDIARAIRTVIKREAREADVIALITANARRIDELESLLRDKRR